jgi:hypothetical protein
MKHQHSTPATASVHAAPPARAKRQRAKKAPTPRTVEAIDPRDHAIRKIAYALYEARGCVDGHALEDWLHAEAQIDRAALTEQVEP